MDAALINVKTIEDLRRLQIIVPNPILSFSNCATSLDTPRLIKNAFKLSFENASSNQKDLKWCLRILGALFESFDFHKLIRNNEIANRYGSLLLFILQRCDITSHDTPPWWTIIKNVSQFAVKISQFGGFRMKNCVLKNACKHFISMLIIKDFPIMHAYFICACLNKCIEKVNPLIKRKLLREHSKYINQIPALIMRCGDYELQFALLKNLVYWVYDNMQHLDVLEICSKWFKSPVLFSIPRFEFKFGDSYDIKFREFLNDLNAVKCKVISVEVLQLNFGIENISGKNVTETDKKLWMDCNEGSNTLTMFCDVEKLLLKPELKKSQVDNGTWKTICINMKDVKKGILKNAPSGWQIEFILNSPIKLHNFFEQGIIKDCFCLSICLSSNSAKRLHQSVFLSTIIKNQEKDSSVVFNVAPKVVNNQEKNKIDVKNTRKPPLNIKTSYTTIMIKKPNADNSFQMEKILDLDVIQDSSKRLLNSENKTSKLEKRKIVDENNKSGTTFNKKLKEESLNKKVNCKENKGNNENFKTIFQNWSSIISKNNFKKETKCNKKSTSYSDITNINCKTNGKSKSIENTKCESFKVEDSAISGDENSSPDKSKDKLTETSIDFINDTDVSVQDLVNVEFHEEITHVYQTQTLRKINRYKLNGNSKLKIRKSITKKQRTNSAEKLKGETDIYSPLAQKISDEDEIKSKRMKPMDCEISNGYEYSLQGKEVRNTIEVVEENYTVLEKLHDAIDSNPRKLADTRDVASAHLNSVEKENNSNNPRQMIPESTLTPLDNSKNVSRKSDNNLNENQSESITTNANIATDGINNTHVDLTNCLNDISFNKNDALKKNRAENGENKLISIDSVEEHNSACKILSDTSNKKQNNGLNALRQTEKKIDLHFQNVHDESIEKYNYFKNNAIKLIMEIKKISIKVENLFLVLQECVNSQFEDLNTNIK